MSRLIVGDVSILPNSGFGARTLLWWGTLGFVLIEGGGFALACGSYLFLMSHTTPWPPHLKPGLLISGAFVLTLLASEIPNILTHRAAVSQKLRTTQIGLVVMSAFGLLLAGIRGFELNALNVRWDDNAYGSIVWALLFLHTTHIVTELVETIVLTVFTFTHEVDTDRYSDVADDCMYWHFVVLAWLPIYALVYWAPRAVG